MSRLLSWQDAGFPLPTTVDAAAIATVNNVIYLFGGWLYHDTDGSQYNQEIFKLDLSSSSPAWQVLSGVTLNHLDCRHQCTTVINERYIYIYHPINAQFHVFDSKDEEFILHSEQNHFDEYGCIVSDNSNQIIYKIGELFNEYNITSNTWNPSARDLFPVPPSPMAHESCVYYPQSHSFITFPRDSPVLEYDITNKAWITPNTDAIPSKSKENSDAVLADDGMIYIIGGTSYGSDPTVYLSDVDVYNPMTQTLVSTTPLDIVSGVVATTAIQGYIYAIGGVNSQSAVSNSLLYGIQSTEISGSILTTNEIEMKSVSQNTESQNPLGIIITAAGAVVICVILLIYFFQLRKDEDPTKFWHGTEVNYTTKVMMAQSEGRGKVRVNEDSDDDDFLIDGH